MSVKLCWLEKSAADSSPDAACDVGSCKQREQRLGAE